MESIPKNFRIYICLFVCSSMPFLASMTTIAASAYEEAVSMFLINSLWPGASMNVYCIFLLLITAWVVSRVNSPSLSSWRLSKRPAKRKPLELRNSFSLSLEREWVSNNNLPISVDLPESSSPVRMMLNCLSI